MKKIYTILSASVLTLGFASCSDDIASVENEGYLSMNIKTLTSTNNRANAPEGYAPKQLNVEILNAQGEVVASTTDFDNDESFNAPIKLEAGEYTVRAHSNNWDGQGSGFDVPYYYGEATATVEPKVNKQVSLTCTQANVKVSVNFSDEFKAAFTEASSQITSTLTGIDAQTFVMNSTTGSAYFPVSGLSQTISVTNRNGDSHSLTTELAPAEGEGAVQARDHFIINYTIAEQEKGDVSDITISIDETTHTYTFDVQIPLKSKVTFTPSDVTSDDVTTSTAILSTTFDSQIEDFNADNVGFEYRVAAPTTRAVGTNWTSENVTLSVEGKKATATITGLDASTSYEGRFIYDDGVETCVSSNVSFATEAEVPAEPQEQIYNAGFESWYKGSNKAFYANEEGTSYWDSSNPGSSSFNVNVTNQETSFVHSGSSAAALGSKYVVIKFAAASLFTGSFVKLIGTKGAELLWGVPFTSRPSALKGYLSYNAPAVNRVGSNLPAGAPAKGSPDECQIFCALLSEQLKVANADNSDGYEMSTAIDWENDPRVIAFGELTKNTSSNGEWESFNIPLVYHNATAIPTHMLIVCSSSKYGDYFHGSDTSKLYLDDFEFEYGTRTVR